MIGLRFRPLTAPAPPIRTPRRPGVFRVDYSQIILDIEHELRQLGVTDAVISTGHAAAEIGADGWPRSGARRLPDPTVVLHLATRHGPLTFTADTYDNWQSNLRAISQTLESLRTLDRPGALPIGAPYHGYASAPSALPTHDAANPNITAPRRRALRVLLREAGTTLTPAETDALLREPDAWRDIYRQAVLRAHPDTGGTSERFVRVTAAMELLRDGGA